MARVYIPRTSQTWSYQQCVHEAQDVHVLTWCTTESLHPLPLQASPCEPCARSILAKTGPAHLRNQQLTSSVQLRDASLHRTSACQFWSAGSEAVQAAHNRKRAAAKSIDTAKSGYSLERCREASLKLYGDRLHYELRASLRASLRTPYERFVDLAYVNAISDNVDVSCRHRN